MEKYMEENPSNPDREEDIRLNKKDISPKKKSAIGYIPIEQAVDVHQHDSFKDETPGEEEDPTGGNEEDFEDAIVKDRERLEQLGAEIKFHQGEGAASVGPGVEGRDIEEYQAPTLGNEPVLVSAHNESMNPLKARTVKSDYELKKDKKTDKGVGKRKENLKTLNNSKKQRSFSKRIKDFFTKQNSQETVQHKKEEYFSNNLFADHTNEPTLNGKPLDKKFIENEDDIAA